MSSSSRRLVAIVAVALLFPSVASSAPANKEKGEFNRFEYTNDAGTRAYYVYEPTDLEKNAPLMVFLHGCQMTGPQAAAETQYNKFAEQRKFVVVYPEQDPNANGGHCWNWFHSDHQHRGAGEASIIAGITKEVIEHWDIDPRRVFVNGISAGGAMTAVMAATYPDIYATAIIHAGCFYRGFPCLASASAVPHQLGGMWAYEEMGGRARVVPIMVVQGDVDVLVPFVNSVQVVQQWLTTDDWVDDGEDNGSVARTPSKTDQGQVKGGHSYSIEYYQDEAGCTLVEYWLVNGMGHAYSGGSKNGEWTDPAGPDVSAAAYEFSMAHPMPQDSQCHEKGAE